MDKVKYYYKLTHYHDFFDMSTVVFSSNLDGLECNITNLQWKNIDSKIRKIFKSLSIRKFNVNTDNGLVIEKVEIRHFEL